MQIVSNLGVGNSGLSCFLQPTPIMQIVSRHRRKGNNDPGLQPTPIMQIVSADGTWHGPSITIFNPHQSCRLFQAHHSSSVHDTDSSTHTNHADCFAIKDFKGPHQKLFNPHQSCRLFLYDCRKMAEQEHLQPTPIMQIVSGFGRIKRRELDSSTHTNHADCFQSTLSDTCYQIFFNPHQSCRLFLEKAVRSFRFAHLQPTPIMQIVSLAVHPVFKCSVIFNPHQSCRLFLSASCQTAATPALQPTPIMQIVSRPQNLNNIHICLQPTPIMQIVSRRGLCRYGDSHIFNPHQSCRLFPRMLRK